MSRRAISGTLALLVTVISTACGQAGSVSERSTSSPKDAIRAVVARDSELGTVRNHASESGTLAQAVRDYVRGLDAIDFSACPPDFTESFERHREAWRRSAPFFDQYPHLRGEMHDLFEMIRSQGDAAAAALEAREHEIWSTWAEVEAAIERHSADV